VAVAISKKESTVGLEDERGGSRDAAVSKQNEKKNIIKKETEIFHRKKVT